MLNKELVINMYRENMTYVEIAEKLGAKEDAIRKCIKRNFPDEFKKIKEAKKAESLEEVTGYFTYKETEEVIFMRTFSGNKPAELECRMSDDSFLSWNRQAYKTNKSGKLLYDEKRNGKRPFDCPKTYEPILT